MENHDIRPCEIPVTHHHFPKVVDNFKTKKNQARALPHVFFDLVFWSIGASSQGASYLKKRLRMHGKRRSCIIMLVSDGKIVIDIDFKHTALFL